MSQNPLPRAFKILLLDDDPEACRLFQTEFEFLGFMVLTTCDMNEALRLTFRERPECIIADVRLRGNQDGLTFVRKLRSFQHEDLDVQSAIRSTPVLVLAMDRKPIQPIFDLEGVAGYVEKPFDSRELRDQLIHVISNQTLKDHSYFSSFAS